jgi:choice-of-anchor A domain-containing protein
MKIRLAITTVFVAFLLFGVSAIDASPVNLGAASQFAVLATTGTLTTSGGGSNRITGPVGIAGSGQAFAGNTTFNNTAYIHTGSTFGVSLGSGGQVIGPGNAQADALLASAVSDANTASTNALSMQPTPNQPDVAAGATVTLNGNTPGQTSYVYTIANVGMNATITINAPLGNTVIVNITGSVTSVTFLATGGIRPQDILYNVTSPADINIAQNSAGIILAPAATVAINSRNLTGQVIAASITLTGGSSSIISTAPVIPEPSSLSIVAIATAAVLGHRFLRRRKSPG